MARKHRRKRITPEKKLQATHKKIDDIFDKMKNKNMSVKSTKSKKHKGKGNSFKTYDKYKTQIKSLMKDLDIIDLKDFSKEKMTEYVAREIKEYKNGDLQAANRLNNRLSALNALELGIHDTNVIGLNARKEINFGDVQEYRNLVQENDVVRVKKSSTWKIATNREMRTIKDRLKKKAEETNDSIDKIAYDYVRFAQMTGSRPTNGLSIQDQHIKINRDGTASIVHYKDKGSLTRNMTIFDKKSVEFLKELKKNSDRGKLFQAYKRDKKPMSNTSLVKRIRECVSEVSEDLKTVKKIKKEGQIFEIEQRITLHSVRKNFGTSRALEIYDYFRRNQRETEKRMKDLLEEMSLREPKVLTKYQDLVDKQNERNKDYFRKNREKKQNSRNDYKKVDMLSVEETALYLTSCELGHFRTDVIKDSYLDREDWKNIKMKYKRIK